MTFRTRTYLTTLAAFALAAPVLAQDIRIDDAYARSANPRSGAAFMVITNTANTDDRLIAAATDAAKRVELHTHIDSGDGVLKMREIEGGILLPASVSHSLKRGGDHVMLMGLVDPLADGDIVTLTLVFEVAGEVTLDVPVDNARKPAAAHGHSD